jgi:hypothetical protein
MSATLTKCSRASMLRERTTKDKAVHSGIMFPPRSRASTLRENTPKTKPATASKINPAKHKNPYECSRASALRENAPKTKDTTASEINPAKHKSSYECSRASTLRENAPKTKPATASKINPAKYKSSCECSRASTLRENAPKTKPATASKINPTNHKTISFSIIPSPRLFKQATLAIIFLLLIITANAQNKQVASDLKKVNEKLLKRRYDFSLTYRLYETYTAPTPIETQVLDVKTWDLMINIRSSQFHVIRNKENYLYVNFAQHFMMVNSVKKYAAEMKQMKELENMINLDTLLASYEKVEELKAESGFKTYRFHMKDHDKVAYTDITINTARTELHKIELYYNQSMDELNGKPKPKIDTGKLPRMEMVFSNYRFPAKYDETKFSIYNYVVKEGKKLKPASSYTRYKFVDNTF